MIEIKYLIDGVLATKKDFDKSESKMEEEFGCKAIAIYKDKKGKVLAKNLCWKFIEKSGIRGV